MALTLQQLQSKGWITQTLQLSHGIGWGYRILKYNAQLGCMAFSSSIYSQAELENEQNQINLFSKLMEDENESQQETIPVECPEFDDSPYSTPELSTP